MAINYGTARCIDCGVTGPRLLPDRFPHICRLCLFLPAPPSDPRADLMTDLPADTLLERLGQFTSNGRFRVGVQARGGGLPEKYDRHRDV